MGVAVTILADGGFGDTKLFGFLDTLGFAYVIRFRGNIHVGAADGETRPAAAWVGKDGRARRLRDAEDIHFGMVLSALRIADPQRRDRLLLLNAFAAVLLTLLGAAGESPGMGRHLKSNIASHRTHWLFRQGRVLYELIPNMPNVRLRPIIARFHEILSQHGAFNQTFGIVCNELPRGGG